MTWRKASAIQCVGWFISLPVFWATHWIYSIALVNTISVITAAKVEFAAWRSDSPSPEEVRRS